MKNKLILFTALGLAAGPLWAQTEDPVEVPSELEVPSDPPSTTPPPMPPEDIPDFEVPDEIVDLRNELKETREALRTSRQAALDALPDDATREDKVAALREWQAANADAIADAQTIAGKLREAIRENRPDREPPVEVPDDIVEAREDLKSIRAGLATSRRELLEGLREEGASAEEIKAELETWREANADDIAAAKELATTVRDWFRENRPERPNRGRGPEMRERRADFRENAVAMRQARTSLREDLEGLTGPERRERIRQFREDQKDLMDERKQLKRELRQSGDDSVGGDRRGG